MEKSYKEYLNNISTFIFDVDGVLTNGSVQVTADGDLLRSMSVKDGYALKQAVKAGYTVCIISGGKNEGVRTRLRDLGITDIYLACYRALTRAFLLKFDMVVCCAVCPCPFTIQKPFIINANTNAV